MCVCLVAGTDDGENDLEQGSVVREFQQDGQKIGKKLSSKTIKAILELICDEAVSGHTECFCSQHTYNIGRAHS